MLQSFTSTIPPCLALESYCVYKLSVRFKRDSYKSYLNNETQNVFLQVVDFC